MIPRFSTWTETFIKLPNGKPLQLEDHQRLILDHVFDFSAGGLLPYDTIVYSCVKKSGKTAVNAIVQTFWALNVEPPNEIITCANKKEQAISRGFKEARGFIERNPLLRREVSSITANQITMKNGSTIVAIPIDFSGEAGSNHGLTLWDELWGFTTERERRLYEELTPVPTRQNSIRFITTYAGFEGESQLLEDIWLEVFHKNGTVKEGIARPLGDDFPAYAKGRLFVYWDHEPRMPWQTAEYYAEQRRTLRVNTYLRLHENRWVSSEVSLFDMEKWDACTDAKHRPPMANKNVMLYAGVDASVKRDRSAVVTVYYDYLNNRMKLGPKRFWQPSKLNPMDLEVTMEAYLRFLAKDFTLCAALFDPYQFHRSSMTLKKDGLPMVEYPQTVANMTEAGQGLFDLVEYGNLVLYPCKDLRYEATCAIGKDTGRGLRIIKDKSSAKIDQIVALAMAAQAIREHEILPIVVIKNVLPNGSGINGHVIEEGPARYALEYVNAPRPGPLMYCRIEGNPPFDSGRCGSLSEFKAWYASKYGRCQWRHTGGTVKPFW
jgi:phage terminase large subunit-like protein